MEVIRLALEAAVVNPDLEVDINLLEEVVVDHLPTPQHKHRLIPKLSLNIKLNQLLQVLVSVVLVVEMPVLSLEQNFCRELVLVLVLVCLDQWGGLRI